jgi:hypothetical protein
MDLNREVFAYAAEILRSATPGVYPDSVLTTLDKIEAGVASPEEIAEMLDTIEQVQATWNEGETT